MTIVVFSFSPPYLILLQAAALVRFPAHLTVGVASISMVVLSSFEDTRDGWWEHRKRFFPTIDIEAPPTINQGGNEYDENQILHVQVA